MSQTNNQLIIYQTSDGKVKIETHFENETVWLSIEKIAELFQKSRSTINEHILNLYKDRIKDRITQVDREFIRQIENETKSFMQ